MAPTYKLTYFDVMGLGEPIRYIFSYAGVNFEDIRIQKEEWPTIKSNMPFGKVPILEVDGKIIHQSISICRYLAREFGLAGENNWQALQIDSVVDTITDLRLAVNKLGFTEETPIAQRKEQLERDIFPLYIAKFEEMVQQNGGYFVGKKISWADLYFAAIIDGASTKYGLGVDKFANLKDLVEKIWNSPNIKAWRAKRPS